MKEQRYLKFKNKIETINNKFYLTNDIDNKTILLFNGINKFNKKYKNELLNEFNNSYICILSGFNIDLYRIVIGSYNYSKFVNFLFSILF